MIRLDPIIARKIRSFEQRRKGLLIGRGICSLVAAGLVTISIVALIDYLILLEDVVRYVLSFCGYAVTVGISYFTSIRKLTRKLDRKKLARLFEAASPSLHEDLISAVELSDPAEGQHWDSDEFRDLLQKDVSDRVDPLPMSSLLPSSLIAWWAKAAGAVFALCLVLALIPDLRFRQLLLRAAVPMANVDRVSRVGIDIVEPDPAEAVVPQGDAIAVTARLSGPVVEVAYLESFKDDGRSKVRMQQIGPDTFTASVKVGRGSALYRIRAGDALTRKYELTSFPRPQVETFRKTYKYPAYSKLVEKTVREQSGDIDALEGTVVDVVLKIDQPVSMGELRIELGDKESVTALTADGPDTLKASLVMSESGTYKVHLVASETSFENEFSPEYEIRVSADLVPSAVIVKPEGDMIVPPDEVIGLVARAKDDLALAKVTQFIRINDGEWTQRPLVKETGQKEVEIRHGWDLYSLDAKPGDQIATKLVATDLKGNTGESTVLRLAISSSGFDPERLRPLQAKLRMLESLRELKAMVDELNKVAGSAVVQIKDADGMGRKQALLKVSALAERVTERAGDTHELVKVAVKEAPEGSESSDLAVIGSSLSRLRRGLLDRVRAQVERAADTDDGDAAYGLAVDGRDSALKASRGTNALVLLFDKLVAAEEASFITKDLEQLASEQERIGRLAPDAVDDAARDGLSRRQQVVAGHTKLVAEMMTSLAGKVAAETAKKISGVKDRLSVDGDAMMEAASAKWEGGAGTFTGEYFSDIKFGKLAVTREDGVIDFDWGQGTPDPKIPVDSFTVRWTGQIRVAQSGSYTFFATTDDGVRLYIDGKKFHESWVDRGPAEDAVKMALEAGRLYELKMEFYENGGGAVARLYWSGPGIEKQPVRPVGDARTQIAAIENSIGAALAGMLPIAKSLSQSSEEARQRLTSTLGMTWEEVRGLKKVMTGPTKMQEYHWSAIASELRDRAELEELRGDGDRYFVSDAALAAGVLEANMPGGAASERLAEVRDTVEKAFSILESGHEFVDAAGHLGKHAAEEQWEKENSVGASRRAREWRWLEGETRAAVSSLQKAGVPAAVRKPAADVMQSPDMKVVRDGMAARESTDRVAAVFSGQLESVNGRVNESVLLLRPLMEDARAMLQNLAPTMEEKLEALAELARELEKKTEEAADEVESMTEKEARETASELLEEQQALNEKIEEVRDMLRRDANAQNLLEEEGLERARDADDALAMLQEPPEKAEELLTDASTTDDSEFREESLDKAGDEQRELAEALEQLAEHYENLETGDAEETRIALRETEEELGIKEQLDEQHELAERLAEMSEMSVEELMEALEGELAENEEMRRELEAIADAALDDAARKMKEVTEDEGALRDEVSELSQDELQKEGELSERAKKIAEEAKKIAEQDIPKIADVPEESRDELDEAAKLLQEAAEKMPTDLTQEGQEEVLRQVQENLEQAEQNLDKVADSIDEEEGPSEAMKEAQDKLVEAEKKQQEADQTQQEAKEAMTEAQKDLAEAQEQVPQEDQTLEQAIKEAQDQLSEAQKKQDESQQEQKQADKAVKEAQKDLAEAKKQAEENSENADQSLKEAQDQLAEALKKQQEAKKDQEQTDQAMQKVQKELAEAQQKTDEPALKEAQEQLAEAQKKQQETQQKQEQAQQAMQDAQESLKQAQQEAAEADQAQRIAERAKELAQEAQKLAQDAADQQQLTEQRLDESAEVQDGLQEMTADAGEDIERAGRHEERLGNEEGEELQELGEKTQETADKEMAEAEQALKQAESADQPEGALENALSAAQEKVDALMEARGEELSSEEQSAEQEPDPADTPASWLARALDALDQSQQASQEGDQLQQEQNMNQVEVALQQAIQEQMAQVAEERSEGLVLEPPQKAGDLTMPGTGEVGNVEEVVLEKGEWGKLPKKLARDLMDAQRENVPEEYRSMVDTYFKAIAKQAKKDEG